MFVHEFQLNEDIVGNNEDGDNSTRKVNSFQSYFLNRLSLFSSKSKDALYKCVIYLCTTHIYIYIQ